MASNVRTTLRMLTFSNTLLMIPVCAEEMVAYTVSGNCVVEALNASMTEAIPTVAGLIQVTPLLPVAVLKMLK